MGLSDRLAALGLSRPHVLVVPVPGWQALRIRGEDAVERSGAVLAVGPADADVLLVAGPPGPGLQVALDRVWDQLPGPRARATLQGRGEIDEQLFGGIDRLRNVARQRGEAAGRPPWAARPDEPSDAGDSGEMGEMDMAMPGGLMMAERAPDRDGLKLDVLELPLGPVLRGWPAGLVIRTQLQGDLIQQARPELLDADQLPAGGAVPLSPVIRALDATARLLEVADWPHAATQARRLRSDAAREPMHPQLANRVLALRRRLARSVALRWRGDGVGIVSGQAPQGTSGDVTARVNRWLATASEGLTADGPVDPPDPSAMSDLLDLTCRLIEGTELGAARLIVASMDLRPGEATDATGAAAVAGLR
jgi:hypothetical protein